MKIDVVLGLQHGDEGKGKICHSLLKGGEYTHVLRFNGGGNAGHTIFHEGKKIVTHLVPSGVFYGKKSIIGPGCVVNINKFMSELQYLKREGINTEGLVYIAHNAHIVTENHIEEDSKDIKIGTTRTGNGPAYRDKYTRSGCRAEDFKELQPFLIDLYKEFYIEKKESVILAEGAQAVGLDIDWGEYPYVTSSHCGIGSVLLNGFSPKNIRNIFGVIKAYDTYVGAKRFQEDDPSLDLIQVAGDEFGATTGRKRQISWLDWDLVLKSIRMNGVNRLIVNKTDILQRIKVWKIKSKEGIREFLGEKEFCDYIRNETEKLWIDCKFSYSPHEI